MFEWSLFGVNMLELNVFTAFLRLILATSFGCALGIERTRRGRAAGMRTYALVCAGAALVMMTSEFINATSAVSTDPGRMGAQVVSGIGFLCAGTILLTGHQKVTGLTTAAGLWASACVGLALGIGFYLGAFIMFFIILFLLIAFAGYRDRLGKTISEQHLYIVAQSKEATAELLASLHQKGYIVSDLLSAPADVVAGVGFTCVLRAEKRVNRRASLKEIRNLPGILYVEEV